MDEQGYMIDAMRILRESQTPEAKMANGVQRRVAAEKSETLQRETDQYLKNSDLGNTGPSRDEYDYRGFVATGNTAVSKPEEGVSLPNRYVKPYAKTVGGFDLATGQKITNDLMDPDGYAQKGANILRDSHHNTVTGKPPQDMQGLSLMAYAVQIEGGNYDVFNEIVPEDWPEVQKRVAFLAAQRVQRRESLAEYFEEERQNPTEALPETVPGGVQEGDMEEIAPESLPENEDWLRSARTVYRELTGDDFEGTAEELNKFALTQMGMFNWNTVYQAALTGRVMASGDQEFGQELLNMIQTYDRVGMSWGGLGRAAIGIFTDPTTYFGFGAGKVASKMGALAAKKALTKLLVGAAAGGGAAALVSAPFGAMDEAMRQQVAVEAGQQEGVDVGEVVKAGAIAGAGGAVIGGAAGAAATQPVLNMGKALIRKSRKAYDKFKPDKLQPYQEVIMDEQVVQNVKEQVVKGRMSAPEAKAALAVEPEQLPPDLKSAVNDGTVSMKRGKMMAQAGKYEQIPYAFAGGAAGLEQDEQGNVTFDPELAIKGILIGAAGAAGLQRIGITSRVKKGTGKGRYLRGGKVKPQDTAAAVAKKIDPAVIDPLYDGVDSLDKAVKKANSMEYIEPTVTDVEAKLRWRPNKEGFVGNDKMKFSNYAYPAGRNTYDFPGCGREAWAWHNDIERAAACYGGACYAEALKIGKQGKAAGVTKGINKQPVRTGPVRTEVLDYFQENGLEATVERFGSDFEFKVMDKLDANSKKKLNEGLAAGQAPSNFFKEDGIWKKLTIGQYFSATKKPIPFSMLPKQAPMPAVISTNIKKANGQDIRLGVDTDGAAWLASEDVMDALIEANPRTLTVYSSAYHKPPEPHPLSDRTIINVTVSGWHPVSETLSRIRWAQEARNNGWNVILREVVAGENMARDEQKLYNRLHNAIIDSDFFVMQQPLHKGSAHSDFAYKLPGCCQGKPGNLHTCDGCEVAEGLGRGFQAFWGIGEEAGEQVLPGSAYKGVQLADLESLEAKRMAEHASGQINMYGD